MKIATVQFSSSADAEENLSRSAGFFSEAAKKKIELLVFPENIFYRGIDGGYKKNSHKIPGSFSDKLAELSIKFSIAAVWGSVVEKDDNCFYNTSLFFDQKGTLLAKYRKIHLFALYDGQIPVFNEEDLFNSGNKIVSVNYNNFNFGMSICYDLRFPELYRALSDKILT